jgi:hypothetical protein
MRSAITVHHLRASRIARLLALLAFAFVWIAPGSALADDNPPIVTGGSVTPTSLGYEGGPVTITAHAIDDFGIVMVYATVYDSVGSPNVVQLIQSGDDEFTGQIDAPANQTNTPQQYGVEVSATDTNGGVDTKIIGYINVAAAPKPDADPVVTNPTVTPRDVPERAGNVTIGATATDDHNIDSVVAIVEGLDYTTFATIELTGQYPNYKGVFDVPDNTTSNPVRYHVRIIAVDDIGQSSQIDGGIFTVAAAATLPPGLVTLSPAWKLFGPIKAGQKARATFVVRNLGKPGSPTLTAYASIRGSAYSIVGAPGTEKTLAIRAGQAAPVVVEFTPTKAGVFNGQLSVRRQDGLQRPLAASLTGIAYK